MKQQNSDLPSVKFYGKTELAVLYSPHCSMQTARKNLNRWIKGNAELYKKLIEVGYDHKRHTFFSCEVELIFRYLGYP